MGTSIDYDTVSHQTIYQHITGGPGSSAMTEASRGWQSVAAELQELQGLVDHAVRGIGTAQQGAAADAATHATTALTPWVARAVTAASGIAARVSEQASSFAHTRDNMPPPRAVPEVFFSQDPGSWMVDHAVEWLPGIQTGHERAQVAAQQDEQRARELMSGYQGSSNENIAVRQHFAAAPTVVAEVADPMPGEAGVNGTHGGGNGAASPGLRQPDGAHPVMTYSAAPSSAGMHAVPGGHGAAPAATAAQLVSGVAQALAAVPTTPQLADGYPSLAGPGSVQPAAVAPFEPSAMLAGPGVAGGERLRGASHFSGGSRFGPRPTAFSAGDDSRVAGPATYGSAEQATAGRSARANAGWDNAPLGATGGRARGDGDAEHRRPSYLIEQDTNAIVGELPRTAPPVIGAYEDYR